MKFNRHDNGSSRDGPSRDPSQLAVRGYVDEALLRVLLVLLIVGQVVFLGSRYRARVDLTEDQLFTLTQSTKRVLSGLQDRLLIECYFSPKDKLSTPLQERRRTLDDFLDELVQLSDGKVVIQRFDPQDDQMVKEKAERLGIRGITIGDQGESEFAFKEIWQGLRMMYGADRQDIIPFVDFHFRTTAPTALWEAEFTPMIKALTVDEKPKIGMLAFATEAGQRSPFGGAPPAPAKGYQQLPAVVAGRYDVERVMLDDGQLVPDDIGTMLLIRPKDLTDRQKYALDQFLMRGGNLVVFADTVEVEIGQQRVFRTKQVKYDAAGSKTRFVDQLAHYGADVDDKVVVEGLTQARNTEGFGIVMQTQMGAMVNRLEPYPYWFHALPLDYSEFAETFAKQVSGGSNGDVTELTARYRDLFEPGVDVADPLFKGVEHGGPGMFWACPVELSDIQPPGVEGKVMLRTSPVAYAEVPPPDFNPLGMDPHPQRQQQAFNAFRARIAQRLNSEPRHQIGLMVYLTGTFGSFFDGKAIPPRRVEPPAPPPAPDPLAGPVVESPLGPVVAPVVAPVDPPKEDPKEPPETETETETGEPGAAAEAEKVEAPANTGQEKTEEKTGVEVEKTEAEKTGAEAEKTEAEKAGTEKTGAEKTGAEKTGTEVEKPKTENKTSEKSEKEGKGADGGPAAQDPVKPVQPASPAQDPEAIEGPPLPGSGEAPEQDKEQDPDPIMKAPASAQLIVIGDADFLRDDLMPRSAEYQQTGPISAYGEQFFGNLIDWLAEDQDLVDLRNKTSPDRRLKFAEDDLSVGDPKRFAEQKKSRGRLLTYLNILFPVGAILAIWILASLFRRSRKQAFLTSVQS